MVEKIEFDTASVQEATDALNALAEAADRAKAAIDALFGPEIVSVSVKTDAHDKMVAEVHERLHGGVRPAGHRFKL